MVKHIDLKRASDSVYSELSSALRSGDIIIYPAQTMYGIGCDYRLDEAVSSLYRIKKRSREKPFIVLASSLEQVEEIAYLPLTYVDLLKNVWPGGMTAILKKKKVAMQEEEGKTVAVRVTSNPYTSRLIDIHGYPVISTSLNFSGGPSFNDPGAFLEELRKSGEDAMISYLCIDPDLKYGAPSTIVDLTGDSPVLIREGIIPAKEIIGRIDG